MLLQRSLLCLAVLLSPAWSQVDPRGNRPVEQGYKAQTCATEKQWPFCTDEDWGPKCPSGCRIQGLLKKADDDLNKKIDRIRKFLDENKKHYRATNTYTEETYDYIREKLMLDSGNDNRYMSLADQLRQRIISLKSKIDNQLKIMEALKGRIKDQVREMERTEVDIDMKLRSCKGSCSSYVEYSVDKQSYVTLEKQLTSLDGMKMQNVESVSTLRVMKSRPMKNDFVSTVYKSGPVEPVDQKQRWFTDVEQVSFFLDGESPASAATSSISKSPGTVQTSHISTDKGSATSSHSSTHTIKCTKTIRKQITITKDGPVEKVEVIGGGPECDGLGSIGIDEATLIAAAKEGKDIYGDGYTVKVNGGTSFTTSLFPDKGSPKQGKSITDLSRGDGGDALGDGDFFHEIDSRSSLRSTTKTVGVKGGYVSDTKTSHVAEDLGAFSRSDVEEDHPDIQARSLQGPAQRLKRDYVGKDCVDILQKHASGHKSGLFKIKPEGTEDEVEVYCDQETMLGGWLLVQQRMDGSVNFNRTWEDYKTGFGSVDQQGLGEVWLGNKLLHYLTKAESLMRVELEDWQGNNFYAEYNVRIGPEDQGYPLKVSSYMGDAGDALIRGQANLGKFLSHDNMKFSTFDRDNDKWEENCADMYGGGWWYNNCQSGNLNGIYYQGGHYDPGSNTPYEIENGIVWLTLKPADYSLKTVRMKIRHDF